MKETSRKRHMLTKERKKPLNRRTIKAVIRVFWLHLRRYHFAVGIIFIGAVTATLAEIAASWYSKKLFDTFVTPDLPLEAKAALLAQTVVALFGVIHGIEWLFHRFRGFASVYFQAHVTRDLEKTAFDNLLGHSYKFFTNNFTGSLVRKVRRLSRAFEEIADQVTSGLLPLATVIIGVLAVLFYRQATLGLALLVWVILFILLYYRLASWKLKFDRAKAEKDSEVTGALADALTNVITIKLFSNLEYEKTRFRKVLDEFTKLRIFAWGIGEGMDAVQGGLMVGINIIIFLSVVRLWREGILTLGDFALVQGLILAIFHRIWDFGRVIRRIYESLADAFEMVEILDAPYDIKDVPQAEDLTVKKGRIEFKKVEFRFHKTRSILEDFNLLIKPGEKIAFVGSSGAGKTTIVSLLLRFHDVTGGKVLIDGQDISRVTQESLRRSIALVPQEPILFHRTLKENIAYGKIDATDEEVVEAAKKAHCDSFISALPYGYETFVGERGVKLSGGERQRVAIARAILANKPILILDEATSSLDSETEALIQDALKTLMKGKTAIVIAHRLSTIRQMDRILLIEGGKITHEGTHEELLRKEGIYKKLWEIQAGGFIAS